MTKTTTLFLGGALSLLPSLAFAQSTTLAAACFQLTSTNDSKLSLSTLSTKEVALQALPVGVSAKLFVGKTPQDQQLCYGPIDTLQNAAIFAATWADTQPLLSLNVRVSGLSFYSYNAPDKKGEYKLGAAQSFSAMTQGFAAVLRESFERQEIHVGVIAPSKSFAFSATDAFMPAFEEDTIELSQGQNILSLGQESWCEESAGCLFWDKVLIGDNATVAYIPSGHVIFPEQFIASPDNSWKLFTRARGTLPFVPDHRSSVNNPSPTSNSTPTIMISVWALGSGKESFDSLGNVEVPGVSPSEVSVRFTPEGISIKSKESTLSANLSLNTALYKTVDAGSTPTASTNTDPNATPGTDPTINKPKPKPTKPVVKYYTVRKGDSLWLIAEKHGVTVTALQKANRLSKKSVLQPGQKLVIPPKAKK